MFPPSSGQSPKQARESFAKSLGPSQLFPSVLGSYLKPLFAQGDGPANSDLEVEIPSSLFSLTFRN